MSDLALLYVKEDLPEWVKPLSRVKFYWNEDNPSNETVHIRAIIDENYVAYRVWSKRKKLWQYRIDSVYWFVICATDGVATFEGMDKD